MSGELPLTPPPVLSRRCRRLEVSWCLSTSTIPAGGGLDCWLSPESAAARSLRSSGDRSRSLRDATAVFASGERFACWPTRLRAEEDDEEEEEEELLVLLLRERALPELLELEELLVLPEELEELLPLLDELLERRTRLTLTSPADSADTNCCC